MTTVDIPHARAPAADAARTASVVGESSEAGWRVDLRRFAHSCGLTDPCASGEALDSDGSADADLTELQTIKGRLADGLVPSGWTPFHAGAAGFDTGVILFPGGSGSGKSTLTAMLAGRGLHVVDDLVLLRRRDAGLEALVPPLPLSLSAASIAKVPDCRSWPVRPAAEPDGKCTVEQPKRLCGRFGVAAAITIVRGRAGDPTLIRRNAAEAAPCLLGSVARFRGGGRRFDALRRSAWQLVCLFLDWTPVYVLSCDLHALDTDALVRAARSLDGGHHETRFLAD